jgi:hypothetical protein
MATYRLTVRVKPYFDDIFALCVDSLTRDSKVCGPLSSSFLLFSFGYSFGLVFVPVTFIHSFIHFFFFGFGFEFGFEQQFLLDEVLIH